MPPATIRDVAQRAHVSIATVSYFLNDKKPVTPSTRRRIEEAIAALEFVPNAAIRVMQGHRSSVIGFVVPDYSNPFFLEVGRGVEDAAVKAGCVMVLCNTDGDPARERMYLTALSEMRAQGVIITPTSKSTVSTAAFQRGGGAVVILDHRREFSGMSSVANNDIRGGELAGSHLLDLGHKQIVFVGSAVHRWPIDERFEGVIRAFDVQGISPMSLRRFDTPYSPGAGSRARIARELLELRPRPTAIVCANDVTALDIQAALSREGIETPRDVSIVGYDDIESAVLSRVPLTTVRQPTYDQGLQAVDLLLPNFTRAADNFVDVVYEPELIVRQSTGRPPRQ